MSASLNTPSPVDTTSTGSGVSFAELLELLGHDTFTAIGVKPVGGDFVAMVTDTTDAAGMAAIADTDVWFGICPVEGPARRGRGRGKAEQVTALPALWADIDVKPGACTDPTQAVEVIDAISEAIGSRPTVMIFSGHGFQPLWTIDDPDNASFDGSTSKRERAARLLRRWGHLVQLIGRQRGAALDSVFDLPRILRVPGTANHKGEPVGVVAHHDHGRPLTFDEIDERLDEYDIPDPADDGVLDDPVDVDTTWAAETCGYVAAMISRWATDTPAARHPWLMSQAVRLTAARRLGCITEIKHQDGVRVLTARMHHLCAQGDVRPVARNEIDDAFSWAKARVAFMTEEKARRELGDHDHILDGIGSVTVEDFGQAGGEQTAGTTGTPSAIEERYPSVDWATLLTGTPEPVEWLIPDVIAAGRSYALAAQAKAGKSLLVFDLVLRHKVKALYLDWEQNPVDLRDRARAMGMTPDDFTNLTYLLYPPIQPLDTPAGGQQLAEIVEHYQPDIVILDTVSRAVVGDENESGTYQAMYRNSLLPLKRAGVAVLRLDHLGKDATKGQRGSSAKGDDVDCVWLLVEKAKGKKYTLRCERQRSADHPQFVEITRQFEPLRHELAANNVLDTVALDGDVEAVVAQLDEAEVPLDWGRRKVQSLLLIKARTTTLDTAIKYRRNRGETGSEPVPENGPSGTGLGTGQSGSRPSGTGQAKEQVTPVPNRSGTGYQESSGEPGSPPIGGNRFPDRYRNTPHTDGAA